MSRDVRGASIRADIEAVLKKHFDGKVRPCCGPGSPWHSSECPTLVDKLFSLYPQLSREELNRIWEFHDYKYDSPSEWRKAITDAIMDWATGKKPTWCKHIYWNENAVGCGFAGPKSTWILRPILPVNDTWTVCPICGMPRPK